MWWTTVSKAKGRSNGSRNVHFLESVDIIMSLDTWSYAVSVDWFLWKPDWKQSWIFCCYEEDASCSDTAFSSILCMKRSLDIGWSREVFWLSWVQPWFLKFRFHNSVFKRAGNTPPENERFITLVVKGPVGSKTFKRSLMGGHLRTRGRLQSSYSGWDVVQKTRSEEETQHWLNHSTKMLK